MSKIDEMLKNEKVEWRKLGEVAYILKGKQFNKRDMLENGEFPVINGGILPSGFIDIFNSDENTITISQGGASAGFVNFIETRFWLGAHAFSVSPNMKSVEKYQYGYYYFNRFLFHILKMKQNKLQDSKEGAGIPSISKEQLSNIEIPLVSKKTQEKIVEILDKFTNHVTELQAELQFRTKQYEYYRDMLLSEDLNKISEKIDKFENNKYKITTVELGSIVEIKNGKDWKSLSTGTIPVYGSGGNMGIYVDKYAYNKPTVLIPRKGSIENIFYLEEPFWNVDTIFYTQIDEGKIIPKYFYYFMQNYDLKSLSTDSTRPSLTQQIVNKIKIKLPPIEIQNKVVKVLDKFQTLLEDTKGLLPTEIEQRRKQYEYYREKLLTFDADCDNQSVSQSVSQLISNSFFRILAEAADSVGVKLFGVEWKSLVDISKGKLEYGSGASAIGYNNKVRYIRITDIDEMGNLKEEKVSPSVIDEKYYLNYGDILFARSGATVGKNFIFKDKTELSIFAGYLIRLQVNERLANSKYVYYCINTNKYIDFVNSVKSGGSQPNINAQQYSRFLIPLPSIPVQEHIVSILDKFDTLVNDIKNGLPKEIELRQKQYEYFREKLLNFSK